MSAQKEILLKVVEDVEKLKADVASLKKPVEVPKVEVSVKVPDYPVPPAYKDIVSLQFNKAFTVRLEPMPDTPAFLLSIVVPKKYSKVVDGEDLRPKVITYSEGEAGVRLWAEKVFNNFDKDTQDLIIKDRPFVEAPI